MAIYNAGKAKSILDQTNQGILGDDAQSSQPAYQNAYQAVMGQTNDIAGTPDWYQRQRLAFYKPTDIDTNAVDLYTSTSAQAEDWRQQGAQGYQQFAKQYGTDTPWLFRAQSEGGMGLDPTQYNFLADPTKRFQYKGDVGSNPYMQSLYGGDAGVQSSYLEAEFNPLTGKQEGAFDLFHTYKQGPAQDKGRNFFGGLMDYALLGPVGGQALNAARSGAFGSGIARSAEGIRNQVPGAQMRESAYDKLYGYVPQAGKNLMGQGGNLESQRYDLYQKGYGALQQPTVQPSTTITSVPTQRGQYVGQNSAYATRFQNPYRRNPYGY